MTQSSPSLRNDSPAVGFFVTCLVDLLRPSVGSAAVSLLEQAGAHVRVPCAQSCCGQPAYNSGDFDHARSIAKGVIQAFEPYDYLVAPSGSCAGMIRIHYPRLFTDDPLWLRRARALALQTYELTSFLCEVLGVEKTGADCPHRVTYHDSCSGLRELGIQEQPRKLLRSVAGLELVERADQALCCGFGGLFSVKYPELSVKLVDDKAAAIEASGADLLAGGDLGCLLNLAGRMQRRGSTLRVFHVAEVLAGMTGAPAIGEGHR